MIDLSPPVHLNLDEVRLLARGLAAQAIGSAVTHPFTAKQCSQFVWTAVVGGADPMLGSLATMLAELEEGLSR